MLRAGRVRQTWSQLIISGSTSRSRVGTARRRDVGASLAREMSAELLTQLVEQCLGFLQIGRPEPLGEPAVDRREEVGRRLPFVTRGPEPGEIACSTELEQPGMLLRATLRD